MKIRDEFSIVELTGTYGKLLSNKYIVFAYKIWIWNFCLSNLLKSLRTHHCLFLGHQ